MGMSAFVSGDVFSAVVNSLMTIVAGLGLAKRKGSAEKAQEKGTGEEEIRATLARVQDLIFNEK